MGKAWQPLVKHYRQGYEVEKGTKKKPDLYMIIVLLEEKRARKMEREKKKRTKKKIKLKQVLCSHKKGLKA